MMEMEVMQTEEEAVVECPHCGSSNEIYLDPSVTRQRYIEECSVCAREIDLRVQVDSGDVMIQAFAV